MKYQRSKIKNFVFCFVILLFAFCTLMSSKAMAFSANVASGSDNLATVKTSGAIKENPIQKEEQVLTFSWRAFLIIAVGLTILYYMARTIGNKSFHTRAKPHSEDNLSSLKEKLKTRHE